MAQVGEPLRAGLILVLPTGPALMGAAAAALVALVRPAPKAPAHPTADPAADSAAEVTG
ncbi:hypothetical protein BN2537_15219 [Streptomyces venezuelae]|nr:hypothetical protein BN2537_15219 [Streptomyces venezuelae]